MRYLKWLFGAIELVLVFGFMALAFLLLINKTFINEIYTEDFMMGDGIPINRFMYFEDINSDLTASFLTPLNYETLNEAKNSYLNSLEKCYDRYYYDSNNGITIIDYNISNDKYLRSVSITNDSELFSKVNFAIITKDDITFNKMVIELNNDYLSGTDGLVDTYKNIFKADLTSRNFASSFSKNFMMKFNYIQFAFYNNDDENCVVNNFTILYTYGFRLKGAH